MVFFRSFSRVKAIVVILVMLLVLEGTASIIPMQPEANAGQDFVELVPVDDTYADGVSPDQNFGSAIRTIVRDVPGQMNDKIAYYKFDVGDVTIRSDRALLRLYVEGITPDPLATNVSAYEVEDNSWSEHTLTWNNRPAVSGKLSGTTATASNTWIELDVTSHVKAGMSASGYVSIAVMDDQQHNRAVRLSSKESPAFKPVLRIQEEPAYVMSSTPANGERHVNVSDLRITLDFDRPMDMSTLDPASVLLLEGDGETVLPYTDFTVDNEQYTFSVPDKLAYLTPYKVKVLSGTVKDAEGGAIADDQEISFMTMPEATDALTVTRYTPWLVNLHLTTMDAVAAGIKGGDGAQRVWSYGIDPTNSDHVMLGTDTTAIYSSEDGGLSYQISGEGLEIIGTVDIAISPDDSEVAYAAMTAGKESDKTHVTVHSGIWKTTDRGETWRHVLHAPYYRYPSGYMIRFGALSPQTSSRPVYVATHQEGVFKSEDEGMSWEYLGLSGNTIGDFYVSPDEQFMIAASLETGIQVSYDGGQSWSTANTGLHLTEAYGITVHPDNADYWVAAVDNRAYKSEDAGQTWTGLPRPSGFALDKKIRKVLFGASTGSIEPPRLYLVGENVAHNVRFSTDLGMNWIRPVIDNSIGFTQGITGYAPDALKPDHQDPYTVWATFNSNPFKSTDGGQTFFNSSSGYSGHRASDFLFDESDPHNIFIAFIDRGLAKSVNPEKDGVYPMFLDLTHDEAIRYEGAKSAHSIARNPLDPDHIIFNVGHWNTHTILAQSFDNGKTMEHIPGTAGNNIKTLAFHPQEPLIIYAGTRYSEDGGVTWQIRDKNVVAVSPVNGDHVWAVQRTEDYFTLFESRDKGYTWQTHALFDEFNTIPIRSVTADLTSEEQYWVATNEGIYKFDGANMTHIGREHGLVPDVDGGLEIFSVAQNPVDHQHYVAGGYNTNLGPTAGLFESRDGGEHWHLIPGMKGVRDIWKVAFHPALAQVYAATSHGTWVYEYEHFEHPARIVLAPTDDTTADEANPDSNSGAAETLTVDNDPVSNHERIAYLKFDLQGITGTIESAVLGVYNSQMTPYEPSLMLDVFSTAASWTESGLVWNGRPQLLDALASASASASQVWERFDVTEYVRAQLSQQEAASFAIRDLTASGKAVTLHAREASFGMPYLEIITTNEEENP
ncbi:DNRLRE domain-containing protein [Paenibacillus sp. 1P07SE]|uniref:CBM96 family carbohydrate-binding protein n=1 Tax=Paenibacillus sp. 1P07SE TaxID=3132209 RepID=UPI0039A40AB5